MDFVALSNLVNSHKNLPIILMLGVFLVFAFLETKSAGYPEKIPGLLRWPHHFLLALFNSLLFRMVLPSFYLFAAITAHEYKFGLFNQVKVPDAFSVIFTIIFLDWTRYYLHRVYHAIPWLWKIHRLHHTDVEVDVTTGFRFHPIELLITTFVGAWFIYLLGAPVYSVFFYEIAVGISNLFNHANIHLSPRWEKALRWILVTPEMHRVHHSADPSETNRNFGFIFSWWDRSFTTFHKPLDPAQMKLGLNLFEAIHFLRFKELLLQPFYDKQGNFKLKNITRPD